MILNFVHILFKTTGIDLLKGEFLEIKLHQRIALFLRNVERGNNCVLYFGQRLATQQTSAK